MASLFDIPSLGGCRFVSIAEVFTICLHYQDTADSSRRSTWAWMDGRKSQRQVIHFMVCRLPWNVGRRSEYIFWYFLYITNLYNSHCTIIWIWYSLRVIHAPWCIHCCTAKNTMFGPFCTAAPHCTPDFRRTPTMFGPTKISATFLNPYCWYLLANYHNYLKSTFLEMIIFNSYAMLVIAGG